MITAEDITEICYETVSKSEAAHGINMEGNYLIYSVDRIIVESSDFKALAGQKLKESIDNWLVQAYWKDESELLQEMVRVCGANELYQAIKKSDSEMLLGVVIKLLQN